MSINIILFIILINFFLFKINESVAKKINLYDIPNNIRKLHKKPTPLNGGIFYFVNLFLIFIFDISSVNKVTSFVSITLSKLSGSIFEYDRYSTIFFFP